MPHPSAADYASLLKGTAATIRASDGSAKVVLAALACRKRWRLKRV